MKEFYPMKPSRIRTLKDLPDNLSEYVLEPKWNGWHVIIVKNDDTVEMFTRTLKEQVLGWKGLKNMREQIEAIASEDYALLGELMGPKGISSSVATIQSGSKASLKLFDVVSDSTTIYSERRAKLESIGIPDEMLIESHEISTVVDVAKYFQHYINTHGCEGVVLKRKNSPYRRSQNSNLISKSWLKIKNDGVN